MGQPQLHWALKGLQPTVPTSGIGKAHRVFGLSAPLHGWLFSKASAARFNSESYQAVLAEVLELIDGVIVLVQENAKHDTSVWSKASSVIMLTDWPSTGCLPTRPS